MDAEMVITDSFHGCVFSIIFHRPFWVIGNGKRGIARFESLLSILDLQDRLVNYDTINNIDLMKPILWDDVDNRLKLLKEESLSFIMQNLNGNRK